MKAVIHGAHVEAPDAAACALESDMGPASRRRRPPPGLVAFGLSELRRSPGYEFVRVAPYRYVDPLLQLPTPTPAVSFAIGETLEPGKG